MKVKHGGQYIHIEDDWEDVKNLKCSCGHLLKDHYYQTLEGSPDWIEVMNCQKSIHCTQFRVSKVQTGNYLYA